VRQPCRAALSFALGIRGKAMDSVKCRSLKAELSAQAEPQIVDINRFLDGNDDLGSIGCNLMEHPGIDAFREAFSKLQRRPDVNAVYAQIAELDPAEDAWPFTDTIVVVGSISAEELRDQLAHLQPDEVGPADTYSISSALSANDREAALIAWWD
jgi:hypothetical protein